MPLSSEPKRGTLSAYVVADHLSAEELNRLRVQDALITASIGSVLPEQSNPNAFRRVLDVGCGPGGWLMALAKASPASDVLIGVDANRTFITAARAQAEAEQVSNQVEFHVMDALRMLEYPNDFFDLVTHRFGMSWVRSWEWRKLLQEYRRVTRRDGIVRCVEAELATGNSPAFTALRSLAQTAFHCAGYLFHPERSSLIPDLPPLFCACGLSDIQTHLLTLEYRANTLEGTQFAEDMRLAFRAIKPFLQKWLRVPDNYDELCREAMSEMSHPGFVATLPLFTVWGRSGYREA